MHCYCSANKEGRVSLSCNCVLIFQSKGHATWLLIYDTQMLLIILNLQLIFLTSLEK